MPLNKGLAICYIRGLAFFFQKGPEIFTVLFPIAMLSQYIFGPLLFLLSTFIILIILLQRGRGGGLTGALGGAGGASAFGVKAGDIFTRITAISVLVWICLCASVCFWYLPPKLDIVRQPGTGSGSSAGATNLEDLKNLDPSLFSDQASNNSVNPSGIATENSAKTPISPTSNGPATNPPSTSSDTQPTNNSGNQKFELPPAVTTPAVTTPAVTTPETSKTPAESLPNADPQPKKESSEPTAVTEPKP